MSREKDYIESYDGREGCFVVFIAGGAVFLIISICLNVAFFIKLYQITKP
jgi:hypothetical protein